jgi:hypothetical protein
MDVFIDNVARILATGHSRRAMLRLLAGALVSAVAGGVTIEPLSAATCTSDQLRYGAKPCGAANHKQGVCCPSDTCCAIGGRGAGGPHTLNCCASGHCYCANGRCAASVGGRCPSGCTLCQAS